MKTRYRDNTALVKALGLQPGEDYGAAEECHTCITQHTHQNHPFEVFFDEMAGPLSQWKAFALGIGTQSGLDRDDVIRNMQEVIERKTMAMV